MKFQGKTYVKSIFGKDWTPAVEAPEDLTATTNDMMRRAGTRRADTGNFDPSRTSDETRRQDGGNINMDNTSTNVDQLEPDNAPSTPADMAGGADDPNLGGDAAGREGGDELGLDEGGDATGMGDMDDLGGGADAGGDMGGDFGGDAADGELPKETPEQARAINNLQQNMAQFYRVLSNTIDSLSSYNMPSSTKELQQLYSSSLDHLTGAKSVMLNLLTTDFTPGNYAYKLRRYVALRHLYSTVLEVVNLHFNIMKREIDAKNSQFMGDG